MTLPESQHRPLCTDLSVQPLFFGILHIPLWRGEPRAADWWGAAGDLLRGPRDTTRRLEREAGSGVVGRARGFWRWGHATYQMGQTLPGHATCHLSDGAVAGAEKGASSHESDI